MSKATIPRCDKCSKRPGFRNWIEAHDVVHYRCECGWEWVE